jgi:hypothetical protein
MTVTHVGSTRKYSSNWDSIFGGSKRRTKGAATGAATKSAPKKKSAKKKGVAKKTSLKK